MSVAAKSEQTLDEMQGLSHFFIFVAYIELSYQGTWGESYIMYRVRLSYLYTHSIKSYTKSVKI